MTTGEKIRAMRKKKEMTLGDLASIVGISVSAVSQYERGKLIPSDKLIKKFADALQCQPKEITGTQSIISRDYDTLINVLDSLAKAVQIVQEPAKTSSISELIDLTAVQLVEEQQKKSEIIRALNLLNDDGLDRVHDYIIDLSANPKYRIKNVNPEEKT